MAKRKRRFTLDDLGFSSKITYSGDRLINKDGSFNIQRRGQSSWSSYHWLIEMPYPKLLAVTLAFLFGINFAFAALFMLVGADQLSGIPEGHFGSDFLYCFFFSVQTFTTVGYGAISPIGILANLLADTCAFAGLLSFAIIAGLFFAKFAQPQSHIHFSKRAILSPPIALHRGHPSFQCRIVNRRGHKIVNLEAQLSVTWMEETERGARRRFQTLELELDRIMLFPLNWTLVHVLDESSPLYGKSLKELQNMRAEFLVMVTGFDESYNQTIHADSSYTSDELVENAHFKPMYFADKSGTVLHLDDIDAVEVARP